MAREFYKIGMEANDKIPNPDPVLIYNKAVLEGETAGSEEDFGITPLTRLSESPERNALIFALQLKQKQYFSNSFYLNRRFNKNLFQNQSIANLLVSSYEFLKSQPDQFVNERRVIFNQAVYIGNAV